MSHSKSSRARPEPRAGDRPAPKSDSRGAMRRASAATARTRRKRQYIAVGSVIASLIFALAIVLLNQSGASAPADPNRRTIGKPEAPVLITEWSDFQ